MTPFGEPTILSHDPPPKTETNGDSSYDAICKILDHVNALSWPEDREIFLKKSLKDVSDTSLADRNGALLTHAAATDNSVAVSILLQRIPDWPDGAYQDSALQSAEKSPKTLRHILAADHPQKERVLKLLDSKKSGYAPSVLSVINSAKNAHLGEGWKIIGKGEISSTVQSNTATIERIFNFNAMNITTVATKDKALSVTETNFRDRQSDTDIKEAYKKLCVFENDPPAYKGKETGLEPRRIQRRNMMQGIPQ